MHQAHMAALQTRPCAIDLTVMRYENIRKVHSELHSQWANRGSSRIWT